MASIPSNSLLISGLKKAQARAIERRAGRLGQTPADYVRALIDADLELERLASSNTFESLARPFAAMLSGLTDAELDKISRPARPRAKV